jgi:streptogramin lyase
LADSTSGHADGTASGAQFFSPDGVSVDGEGNIYVADEINNRLRKVPSAGGTAEYADGTGAAAQFYGLSGIAIDGAGNLIVADTYNHRNRKVTQTGVATTIAGNGATGAGNGGYAAGSAGSALFRGPAGIAVDGLGNVYITDYGNNKIRKINTAGSVSTVAGSVTGEADGPGPIRRICRSNRLGCRWRR